MNLDRLAQLNDIPEEADAPPCPDCGRPNYSGERSCEDCEAQARRDQATQDRIDAWHADRRLHCPEEYDADGNRLPFGSFC